MTEQPFVIPVGVLARDNLGEDAWVLGQGVRAETFKCDCVASVEPAEAEFVAGQHDGSVIPMWVLQVALCAEHAHLTLDDLKERLVALGRPMDDYSASALCSTILELLD